MRRIIQRIAAKFDSVHFCYEPGPTRYGLHRLIRSLGHECVVVAPSLIPRKPGYRVKTNRRDALALARLLRAGELTAVWVPGSEGECWEFTTVDRFLSLLQRDEVSSHSNLAVGAAELRSLRSLARLGRMTDLGRERTVCSPALRRNSRLGREAAFHRPNLFIRFRRRGPRLRVSDAPRGANPFMSAKPICSILPVIVIR